MPKLSWTVGGLVALLVGGCHGAARLEPRAPTLEMALTQTRDGRPLVVEFEASWCAPCRDLERRILPDPSVQAALRKVNFVRYDIDDRYGGYVARRLLPQVAVPALLSVDAQGIIRRRRLGSFGSPSDLVAFLDDAVIATLSQPALEGRLAARADDPRMQLAAGRWYAAHGDDAAADACLHRAEALSATGAPEIAGDAAWELLREDMHRAQLRGEPLRARLVESQITFARTHPASSHVGDALEVVAFAGPESEAVAPSLLALAVEAHARDAALLNHLVYLALAVRANDTALAAAERIVQVEPDDASYWDTLAEVHHMRGERDAALVAEDRAIALAHDRHPDFREHRRRFARGQREPHPSLDGMRRGVQAMLAKLDAPSTGSRR